MTAPFLLTLGRWFNKLDEDGDYRKAPAYREGFTYADFTYGTDTGADFEPPPGVPLQYSLICAPSTRLLVIDVDYPENLPQSAAGQLVSWNDAISVRGSHFHVGVDMTGAEPGDWPAQGRCAWGDIKSNGFVAAPGSVHFSGELYQPASATVQEKLVKATPELLAALRADRTAYALTRLNEGRRLTGGAPGTRLEDGAYLYASGFTRGSWNDLPDGFLRHDDELKDLLWDMHVEFGLDEEQCRGQWFRLAGALRKPWTERDFTRHWHRLPARRAQVLDDDDSTRLLEDFGLAPLPPVMQRQWAQQREDYEKRTAQVSADTCAAGPPTPVPADGPFEDPADEQVKTELFDWFVGSGAYPRVFDAGAPSDSDNARAALNRVGPVSVYLIDRGIWLKRVGARWDDEELGANLRPVLAALEEVMPPGCADPVKQLDMDPDTQGPEIAALKSQAKNLERFKSTSARQSIASAAADTAVRYSGRLSSRASALDTEQEILWAGGVPWDLRASGTVPVRAALDRRTPHLMSAAVVPDPSGPMWRWQRFCEALWPGSPDDGREWALDVFAACFTGYSDAVMPILMGDPGRGKTHFVTRLIDVLGGNAPWSYGGVMNADLLRSDARLHGTFTLDLKGKRLAFIDEAPGHGIAAQRRLKSLTGGGALQGNRMRENPVSFTPTHTLVMTANHEDPPPLDEPALQRRARLIFFEGDVTAVEEASMLIDGSAEARAGWREEMPAVLADMMRRAARWLADKHVADSERSPDRWRFKAADEVQTQDPVMAWLESGEVTPDEAGTRSALLRENFVSWCRRQGTAVPTETKWGRRLTEMGFAVTHRDAGGRYRPLRVIPPGLAEFMQGPGTSATVHPTVHPVDPQVSSSAVYGLYGLYSQNNTTHKTNLNDLVTPPLSRNKGIGETEQTRHDSSGTAPDLGMHGPVHGTQTLQKGARPCTDPPDPGAGPVAPDKAVQPDSGEITENGQNAVTPPKRKTPGTKLTPEEKLERDAARKAKLAQVRLEAKAARVAELGGALVQLPAVVLRDQRILPVTAAGAKAWLADMTELSVDIEHSGFPAQHRDYLMRCVQLGNEWSSVVFSPQDPAQAEVIKWALANAAVLHAHSALADLIPLERAGLGDKTMWDRMQDTVLLAKLTDPGLCDSDEFGLKALAKNLLGPQYALSWRCDELKKAIFSAGGWIGDCEVTTPVERSGWAQIPLCQAFIRYAASDVMDCSAIARVLGIG